ncbi:MAG: ATP-binding protein [Candidatus Melainabacteria bacterium]
MTYLLVSKDLEFINSLTHLSNEKGISFTVENNVSDLQSKIANHAISIIILDKEAIELADIAKISTDSENIPIWIATQYFEANFVSTILAAGITNLFLKSQVKSILLTLQQHYAFNNILPSDAPHLEVSGKYQYILQAFLHNATDVIWAKDRTGRYEFINEAGANFLGSTIQNVLGKSDLDLFTFETASRIKATDLEVLTTGKPSTVEFQLDSQHGNSGRYYLAMKAPYFSSDNEIEGLIGIVRDITDRKCLEEKILEAKIFAETANQRKSDFLANMSHELRTPLHNIITSSSIVINRLVSPDSEKALEYFSIINRNGKHLLQIIDDLLDISSIEAGKYTISKDTFVLEDFIADTVSLIDSLVSKNSQTLEICLSSNLPVKINADSTKLRQALVNILSNAIKYSPPRSKIVLTFKQESGYLLISVEDHGPGIPTQDLQRIFLPFEQGHSPSVGYIKGTGLGLPLTRRIIELHGGRISVESIVGQGTKFSIFIPIEKIFIQKQQKVVLKTKLSTLMSF